MKKAGDQWNAMSESEKMPYNKQADLDKVRYEKQCAELDKKGFFILDNGTKSTDPENVPRQKKRKPMLGLSDSEEEKKEEPKLTRKPLV